LYYYAYESYRETRLSAHDRRPIRIDDDSDDSSDDEESRKMEEPVFEVFWQVGG